MHIEIGVKSDPVEYRYSYEWLFALMERLGVSNLQLGSFFELYRLPDAFFERLRTKATDHGVAIRSCFTAHRELGGFFVDDADLNRVAFESYARFLEVGAILGAESVGSNPGAVFRDAPTTAKEAGSKRYLRAMEELSRLGKRLGLRALTVEPMSSLAEPPSTPNEIDAYMTHFARFHATEPRSTIPIYLCGDVSHGVADRTGRVIHTNEELFEIGIPWMWEFHLKNTDPSYSSTFGFGPGERAAGIVDLAKLRTIVENNASRFPSDPVVAYLEINGPKLGRDYSDHLLESQLTQSIDAVRRLFFA